jgi:hypothetical protein
METEEMIKRIHPILEARLKWQRRALEAESKLEAYQLVGSYVQDLIDMWPTITMRTLYKVTAKIADLKEALELAKK